MQTPSFPDVFLSYYYVPFNASTLLARRQVGHQACNKNPFSLLPKLLFLGTCPNTWEYYSVDRKSVKTKTEN